MENSIDRITALEQEVATLRATVARLEAKLEQFSKELHPQRPQTHVVGSMDDSVSKSLHPDS